MKNELGKCIKSFDCDSVINGKRFLLITATVLMIVYTVLKFDINSVANNANLLLTCMNKEDLDFLVKYCKNKVNV